MRSINLTDEIIIDVVDGNIKRINGVKPVRMAETMLKQCTYMVIDRAYRFIVLRSYLKEDGVSVEPLYCDSLVELKEIYNSYMEDAQIQEQIFHTMPKKMAKRLETMACMAEEYFEWEEEE